MQLRVPTPNRAVWARAVFALSFQSGLGHFAAGPGARPESPKDTPGDGDVGRSIEAPFCSGETGVRRDGRVVYQACGRSEGLGSQLTLSTSTRLYRSPLVAFGDLKDL